MEGGHAVISSCSIVTCNQVIGLVVLAVALQLEAAEQLVNCGHGTDGARSIVHT